MEEGWLITTETKLRDHFRRRGDRVLYHCDDNGEWKVNIRLDALLPKQKGERYPVCLDGALAGPPEGCGGIRDFKKSRLGGWNPDDFDPKQVTFTNPRSRFKIAFTPDS